MRKTQNLSSKLRVKVDITKRKRRKICKNDKNGVPLQHKKTQSYLMGQRIKKLKKIRLHREGTDQLVYGMIAIVAIAAILWSTIDNKIPFWIFVVVFGTVYGIVLNFYRCPIRYLNIEDTDNLVVAPADG